MCRFYRGPAPTTDTRSVPDGPVDPSSQSWPWPETDFIQDASAIATQDGEWVVVDLLASGLTGLEEIRRALRGLGLPDVCGMFTVNCEFSFLVRLTDGATRLFLTNPDSAVGWRLARDVVYGVLPAYEPFPPHLGDTEILEDWGIPAGDLIRLADSRYDDVPGGWDDLPDAIRRRLGILDRW